MGDEVSLVIICMAEEREGPKTDLYWTVVDLFEGEVKREFLGTCYRTEEPGTTTDPAEPHSRRRHLAGLIECDPDPYTTREASKLLAAFGDISEEGGYLRASDENRFARRFIRKTVEYSPGLKEGKEDPRVKGVGNMKQYAKCVESLFKALEGNRQHL